MVITWDLMGFNHYFDGDLMVNYPLVMTNIAVV